jgi:lipopolysaccharide/colanic/teichoic acid biosynthesis glycosyltransferase
MVGGWWRALLLRVNRLALLDRVVACVALLVVLPVAFIVAIAIVLDSGFPIFFSQQRLGQYGRRFWMPKFRKFQVTVGRNTRPLTLVDDARFTRVGSFLAKTKLDELPQLWSILRGDMAIVGPRPEVPDFAECFSGPYRQVLDYRPGVFGPSQAAFRDEAELYPADRDPQDYYREVLFPAKATLDLTYYPSRTVFGDLMWVWRGILAICGADRTPPATLTANPKASDTTRALAGSKATW